MDRDRVQALFDRIARFAKRVRETAGADVQEWTAKTEEGASQKVVLSGVKALVAVEDDVASAFVWLWSLKDRLKSYSVTIGKSPKWIEAEVTTDPVLSICADLANEEKHDSSYSRGSRSMKFPRLGLLTISVPGNALESILIGPDWTHTAVANAALARFSMPVVDGDGRVIADAFVLLERAAVRWEELWFQLQTDKSI